MRCLILAIFLAFVTAGCVNKPPSEQPDIVVAKVMSVWKHPSGTWFTEVDEMVEKSERSLRLKQIKTPLFPRLRRGNYVCFDRRKLDFAPMEKCARISVFRLRAPSFLEVNHAGRLVALYGNEDGSDEDPTLWRVDEEAQSTILP